MPMDDAYLRYIADSIARVERYVSGGRDVFMSTLIVQDATLYRLHTLAEATQRLSPELKARHPHVPWREIGGFRNVLVHDYMQVRLATVWQVVEQNLPELKSMVGQILTEFGGGPASDVGAPDHT